MTFKETEFPSLIYFLSSFTGKNQNPFLLKDLVQLMVEWYEKIPLYPGIIENCLAEAVQPLQVENIQTGQKIYFQVKGKYYAGKIIAKHSFEIQVKLENENQKDSSFALKDLQQVYRLNQKIFEELWPSLVFEEKVEGV